MQVSKSDMDENSTFGQITALMERCKQLETVDATQWLLINNMEKKIRELVVSDATKTDQLATLDEHLNVLNTLIRDQQNIIKKLVTHKIESEENFATLSHQIRVMKSMIDVVNDRTNEEGLP